jgi:hypothetical protein
VSVSQMLMEDSTTCEYVQKQVSKYVHQDDDGGDDQESDRSFPLVDESVILPFNIQSMTMETMQLMRDEITEQIRKEKELLDLKRKEINMAFESFDRLSFVQKYMRRNSRTRQVISNGIYGHSTEITDVVENLQRLQTKLIELDAVIKTAHQYAALKEKHKKWHEGFTHSIFSSPQDRTGDAIFIAECRLSLCQISLGILIRVLGIYLFSKRVDFGPYENRLELYNAIRALKLRLVDFAQAFDETRITALPADSSRDEILRINELTDATYASELMMLAGIEDFSVSADTETGALGAYSWQREKRIKRQARYTREDVDRAEEADKRQAAIKKNQAEIDISDLLQIDRQTLLDQLGVSRMRLQLRQKFLAGEYQRYDNMTVAQKFIRRNSVTKGLIATDIYACSLFISTLVDEVRYWSSEVKRLDDMHSACVSAMLPRTKKGVEEHGTFLRSNFDAVAEILPELETDSADSDRDGTNHLSCGYSCLELHTMISEYDRAIVTLAEVTLAATTAATTAKAARAETQEAEESVMQRARSAVSDDNALLCFHSGEDDDDDGVDIDNHLAVEVPKEESKNSETPSPAFADIEGDLLEEEPKMYEADHSEEIAAAQVSLQELQTNLEKIPLDFIYRLNYRKKCAASAKLKDSRRAAIAQLGLAQLTGHYVNDSEKYQLANTVNRDLLEVVRACEEFRIHALPEADRQKQLAKLRAMDEMTFLTEIFQLAGVQGYRVTEREERIALAAAKLLENKRLRTLSTQSRTQPMDALVPVPRPRSEPVLTQTQSQSVLEEDHTSYPEVAEDEEPHVA